MPAYRFEALQADGQTRKGTLEADSARSARSQLRAQGLVPLDVGLLGTAEQPDQPALPWWQRPLGPTRKAFSSSQRAVWTRQLAELVGSGLTVERALAALTDESEHERQRHLLAAIRAEVNAGSSLGRALERFPHEFPAIDRAVIAAGEQSGQLGQVLSHLADDLEARQVLRSKLVGAALYPAIVTLVAWPSWCFCSVRWCRRWPACFRAATGHCPCSPRPCWPSARRSVSGARGCCC